MMIKYIPTIKINLIRYNAIMKKLLVIILLTQFLFSATPEQVERYLSISNADEELLALESQFSKMQNNFQASDTNTSEEKETYDMQMLSIRFKEYLEKHLSENEMDEILQTYKSVVFLQLISANGVTDSEPEEVQAYIKTFENNESSSVRMDIVEKINEKVNNKESITIMFHELIKPLMQASPGGQELNDETMKKSREAYLQSMIEKTTIQTLFACKDFTMEELEELLKVVQTPAIEHEVKAVFGGMSFALKEFFLTLASRYDISKH